MKQLRFFVAAIALLCSTSMFAQADYPEKGYSGSVEFAYGIGIHDYWVADPSRINITTVHGYQFNPYLFVGAGIGVKYWLDYETISLPIFADVRGSIPLGSSPVALFADFRVGYSPVDLYGVYVAPSIGVRLGRAKAATFAFGYEMTQNSTGGSTLNFRVGFEW